MILAIDTGTRTLGWSKVSLKGVVQSLGAVILPMRWDSSVHHEFERRCAEQCDFILHALEGVTVLAAESLSFPRSSKAVASVSLCWGMIIGVTVINRIKRFSVPPKTWQHKLSGVPMGTKIEYPWLSRKISDHIGSTGTEQAKKMVTDLNLTKRPHAIDAAGIGIYTATIGLRSR